MCWTTFMFRNIRMHMCIYILRRTGLAAFYKAYTYLYIYIYIYNPPPHSIPPDPNCHLAPPSSWIGVGWGWDCGIYIYIINFPILCMLGQNLFWMLYCSWLFSTVSNWSIDVLYAVILNSAGTGRQVPPGVPPARPGLCPPGFKSSGLLRLKQHHHQ